MYFILEILRKFLLPNTLNQHRGSDCIPFPSHRAEKNNAFFLRNFSPKTLSKSAWEGNSQRFTGGE